MNTKLLQAVSAEQTRLLYSNAVFSLLASLIVAPALTLAVWHKAHTYWLILWLLVTLLITVSRYYLVHLYKTSEQHYAQGTWLSLFLLGTFMAGSAWGAIGLFFSPVTELNHWFLTLFVLVGLSGGALASLSSYYFAYVLFTVPAFLPIVIQLSVTKIHDNTMMSWLIVLFLVLTTLLSRRSNSFIDKTILMRIEREAMSQTLEDQIETVAAQHARILETQSSLRSINELFETAFDTTHVMYAYLDQDFNFMRVNKAYAEKAGKRREDFVGKNHFDLYPDGENKKIFEQVRDSGASYHIEEKPYLHPLLGMTYWDWSLQPLLNTDGKVIGLLLAVIDVTARKQAQLDMEEKEAYLQSIMDATVEVILTMDGEGMIEMVNPAIETVFGYRQEEIIGRNIALLMPENIGKHHQMWVSHYMKTGDIPLSGRRIDTEGRRKDGSIFPLEISVSDKIVGEKHIFTSIMRDITEQRTILESLKVKNTELEYLSSHDDLTGLHNRRTGDEFLQREWNRAVRAKTMITVMMIDIDHFKKYNDHYGHQAGDACLQRVASSMKSELNRPSDMVARYGGEEFIAILPETGQEGALLVAENIRQAVSNLEIPHEVSEKEVVTVSIGIATTQPLKLMNYEKLVSCADKALYQAKKEGRNRVSVSGEAPSAKSAD